jgi:hypothetical protein
MNKRISCLLIVFSTFALGACATPPDTREHMLATYAHQHAFQKTTVDGNDMYCSTRPHGTHQCITEGTLAAYMDHTSTTVPWVSPGANTGTSGH